MIHIPYHLSSHRVKSEVLSYEAESLLNDVPHWTPYRVNGVKQLQLLLLAEYTRHMGFNEGCTIVDWQQMEMMHNILVLDVFLNCHCVQFPKKKAHVREGDILLNVHYIESMSDWLVLK